MKRVPAFKNMSGAPKIGLEFESRVWRVQNKGLGVQEGVLPLKNASGL